MGAQMVVLKAGQRAGRRAVQMADEMARTMAFCTVERMAETTAVV
jgi:hypothetical protein